MKKYFFLIGLCFTSYLHSQSISPNVVNSSGSTLTNSNSQITYSVGEVAITKVSNSNSSITQGFLQAELEIVGITENELNLSIFPNPASDLLQIEGLISAERYFVKITDMHGREVLSQVIEENKIPVNNLQVGNYTVQITNEKQTLNKTQLIIKVN